MILLILTIILTSYLTISFKVLGRLNIPALQAIVINYFTCVITGSLMNRSISLVDSVKQPWFLWAIGMGLIFVLLFNIIAFTAQRIGVAVASVANKLSLVIPFLFSIYLYDEKLSALKIAGIVLALVAVVFTCWPHKDIKGSSIKSAHGLLLLVPLILFLGSGMLDTLVKYVEQRFLNHLNNDHYFITAFAMAGNWNKSPISRQSNAAGCRLGRLMPVSGRGGGRWRRRHERISRKFAANLTDFKPHLREEGGDGATLGWIQENVAERGQFRPRRAAPAILAR